MTDPESGYSGSGGARVKYGLATCIPMSDATFSVLTSVYTIGGLFGSLFANVFMDRWGRKGAVRSSAIAVAFGAGMMGVAGSLTPLIFGRCAISWNATKQSGNHCRKNIGRCRCWDRSLCWAHISL